jgi:hypothetical protein
MRRYATGLQLVLLVCAGAASGYLWRAALDPRSTVAPSLVLRGPDPTWLFVKPRATSAGGGLHVQAERKRSVQQRAPAKRVSPAVKRHEPQPSAELASVATPKHTVTRTNQAALSRSNSDNPRTSASRSKRLKPRTATPPAPPAPAAEKPKPHPVPSPPSRPASPAAPVAQPAASDPSTKPGWGKGDQNHDHSGPPGQSGKGNSKK